MTITEMVQQAHQTAKRKGFWDTPRETGTMLALIHSEVSEALEADRNCDDEGFAEELADIVIRVADLAGGMGIDLETEIARKMTCNAERPHLHGKQY